MGCEPGCIHEAAEVNRVVAGGALFMPGSKHDYERIKTGLDSDTVTRRQLQINATRILRMAKKLTNGSVTDPSG